MSMRLAEGVDEARYANLAGKPLNENRIQQLIDLGMVERGQGRLRASKDGRPVLNAILRELAD